MTTLDHTSAPLMGHALVHFAGGYETDVYRTADRRFVVKHKPGRSLRRREALREARVMRAIAERFTSFLGARHTIPGAYLVARSGDGVHVLVVQPFLEHAKPLHALHADELAPAAADALAAELREVVRRAWTCYRATGMLPDLYGLGGATPAERRRQRAWYLAPLYLWTFFVTRTLLRSHNLLLTQAPEPRVVLVDYDIALSDRHRWVRRTHSAVRALLFVRDLLLLRRRADPSTNMQPPQVRGCPAAPLWLKGKLPARRRKPFSTAQRLSHIH